VRPGELSGAAAWRALPVPLQRCAGCRRAVLMAASSSGGSPPHAVQQADSDDDIIGEAFERACRAAQLRADARFAAQEAMILFASEWATPASPQATAESSSAAEPAAAGILGNPSGLPAASSNAVPVVSRDSGFTGAEAGLGLTTPKRKREVQLVQPEPLSPEDDNVWQCASVLSQTSSPSSVGLASPLGRMRLSLSPAAAGVHGASASSGLNAAVLVPPDAGAQENQFAATQVDSADEEHLDDDVMEYLRSPRSARAAAAGAEPSAAPSEPPDTPNWECMSPLSGSSGSTSVDTVTLVHRMVRRAEMEAELEELENNAGSLKLMSRDAC